MRAGGFLGRIGALLSLSALCVLLLPARAQAAELAWRAPDGCDRAEVVREQVGKLVGRRFDTIEGIDFAIAIAVQADGRHTLVLRSSPERADGTPSAPRERMLEGASCVEVSDAASVAMALAIAERDEERAREQAVAAPEAEPEAQPSAAEARENAPDDDATPLYASVGAGGLLETGALPSLAIGVQLELALTYGALRAGVLGALFAPQSAELPSDDSGARFDFVLGALVLCGESSLAPAIDLLACAGMELGRIAAEGINVRRMGSGDAAWYAPRVDLQLGYALTETLRVGLRAGVAVPLARPEFLLNDRDRVHQPANVSARLLIGLELRL